MAGVPAAIPRNLGQTAFRLVRTYSSKFGTKVQSQNRESGHLRGRRENRRNEYEGTDEIGRREFWTDGGD